MSSAIGRPIQEVVTHADLLELLAQPTEGRVSSREITLPNGKIYYGSVSPVIADGKLVGKVCIMRDITYYKQLDSLKSDFVATVSHDLRSPLTLMRGYATMLQMVGDLNEQQKTYANKIVLGVENMTRLVNNLLDLGRIEAGIGLQVEKVTAGEVVSQVIASLQPQASQKNLQLTLETPDQAVPVEADRALLQQAVYNLVENAIKYTPSGGQVKINLRAASSGVALEVRDTGIGIAPLDLPHMFEKFYRSGRREAYQQRGTGLGLAIVKSIAERHGGRVWVESQLGKGSTFYFELPYQQAQVIIPNKDN
jgi:signal transduction histidine kinase